MVWLSRSFIRKGLVSTLSMTVDPTGALNCDRELSALFGSGLTETAALVGKRLYSGSGGNGHFA